jgi:hypothetical protein
MAFYAHDFVDDSPINNFATINALDTNSTLSEGNLKVVTGGNNYYAICNFPITEGKWYYELAFSGGDPAQAFMSETGYTPNSTGNHGGTYGMYNHGQILVAGYGGVGVNFWGSGNWTSHAEDTEYNAGTDWKYEVAGIYIEHTGSDIIIYLYRNGVLRRKARAGSSLTHSKYYFGYKVGSVWPSSTQHYNFGQDPYLGGKGTAGGSYADSAGYGQFNYKPVDENGADLEFYSLCTANIPEGPIKLSQDQTPSDNFKAVTYAGVSTGSGNFTVPVGFQSDLIWIKRRNNGNSHNLFDSVRGFDKWLISDYDGVERNNASNNNNNPKISTVNSSGFTVHDNHNAEVNDGTAGSASKYIAWCWRAAGSPTQDYASANDGSAKIINEDGTDNTTIKDCEALKVAAGASITPSKVSANRQNGFSIVKYDGNYTAGASIPHGLSSVEFIIVKNISSLNHWTVYHKYMTYTHYASLDYVAPFQNDTPIWHSETTSTTFSFAQNPRGNSSGETHIAYCWHSVAGYSKFGMYTGMTAGKPYIELGFRPALIMIKAIDDNGVASSHQGWSIFDTARDDYNPAVKPLYANASYIEGVAGNGSGSVGGIDLLSNGFRILDGTAAYNGISGVRHMYMAFAEQPFSGPSNAR